MKPDMNPQQERIPLSYFALRVEKLGGVLFSLHSFTGSAAYFRKQL